MANLSLTIRFVATTGSTVTTVSPATQTVSMAGDNLVTNAQTVSSGVAAALVVGDIGTPGYAVLENRSGSNTVQLSLNSNGSSPFCKIKPGEFQVLRPAVTAVYAIAIGGSAELAYTFLED